MIFRASIPEIREGLVQPFQVREIARFGTIRVYAYRSLGEIARHRHLEFDEVFLVYEGLVTFWTDREEITLKPDELIRIPAGLAHRSGSRLPSLVLLFRRDLSPERWNGSFRTHEPAGARPEIARIHEALRAHPPFTWVPLLMASGVRYYGLQGNGPSPIWTTRGPMFLLLLRGEVEMMAEGPGLPEPARGILGPGELAVLPGGVHWRWQSQEPSTLLLAEGPP